MVTASLEPRELLLFKTLAESLWSKGANFHKLKFETKRFFSQHIVHFNFRYALIIGITGNNPLIYSENRDIIIISPGKYGMVGKKAYSGWQWYSVL